MYVGDSVSDGLASKEAGIGFIGVLTGMTSREKLGEFNPLGLIDELEDLLPLVAGGDSKSEIEQAVALDQDRLG